jgi:hypothetical protein
VLACWSTDWSSIYLPHYFWKESDADQPRFLLFQDLPLYVAETAYDVETMTITETLPPSTVTVPAPANTRLAARPVPESVVSSSSTQSPRTTAIDMVEDPKPTLTPQRYQERRPPPRWFGRW